MHVHILLISSFYHSLLLTRFLFQWVWIVFAIRYHRNNKLPKLPPAGEPGSVNPFANSAWLIFPSVPLQVTSIILLVCGVVLTSICAWSSIINIVYAPLLLLLSIFAVVGAFIPPNRALAAFTAISMLVLHAYGWASFAFYILYSASYWSFFSFGIAGAVFCFIAQVVSLVYCVYAIRWFHHTKWDAEQAHLAVQPNFINWPRKALITLSSLSFVTAVGAAAACGFTGDLLVRAFVLPLFRLCPDLTASTCTRSQSFTRLLPSSSPW